MPVWHELTREVRASGELAVVGIVQEQHPDRARLFAQWHEIEWPILWDPFDLTGSKVVPNVWAIDEAGVVVAERPDPRTFLEEFLARPAPAGAPPPRPERELGNAPPHLVELDALPGGTGTTEADPVLAALSNLLWSTDRSLDAGIGTLAAFAASHPGDAAAQFRLGVAYRLRHDREARRPGDFQAAADGWRRALELDPNQYIWRRRIQQYGPRLDKPYPFYTWVDEAREAIRARGGTPVELEVPLTGSERAGRSATFVVAGAGDEVEPPDPEGRIERDAVRLVALEPAVVFDTTAEHRVARVHLELRPDRARDVHWNNDAGALVAWIEPPPEGWSVDARRLELAGPPSETSGEVRRLELELRAPTGAAGGAEAPLLRGYALYYVCEGERGTCVYRRQDFTVPLSL